MEEPPPASRPNEPARETPSDGEYGSVDAVSLGEVRPRGTRQQWRRSATLLADGRAYVGTADGRVIGLAPPDHRFGVAAGDRVVALLRAGEDLVVGTRGADGWIRGLDPATGDRRWGVRTADDVGEPTRESTFFQPFVVDLAAAGGSVYAAARRYERSTGPGPDRRFESVVYAVRDGEVAWRHRSDASAIAVDADADRVAVAYNRCPGDDRDGLVVLDPDDGHVRWRWDPAGDGGRRVGDVALVDGGIAAASHADYRGYLVSAGSAEWRVDLGRPQQPGTDRVYTYPTHVGRAGDEVAFATGNTFPEDGRETDARHDGEHSVTLVDGGSVTARDRVGGWIAGLAASPGEVVVPCGQHFRDRDADVHGVYAIGSGDADRILATEGPVVALDAREDRVAAVEEPIEFHDGDGVHGAYRLHLLDR